MEVMQSEAFAHKLIIQLFVCYCVLKVRKKWMLNYQK